MATPRARTRRLGSACDRCYELKERCERLSVTSACARCDRLNQICLTVRPVRPAGRRPQHRERTGSRTTSSQSGSGSSGALSPRDVGSWLRDMTDLTPDERDLLVFLLSQPQALQYYVVGPSFVDAEQRSFATLLPAALPVLKDAYLAYAGVLKSLHPEGGSEANEDEDADKNLRHASSAMVTLRTLPIGTAEDAALCLTLGVALASFVYAAIGVGVSDICHYCLSTTRRFTETGMLDSESEPQMTFLVLLETMDCMVNRRKPTIRMLSRTSNIVDRRLGLCLPLLPYYHDLCDISHSLINTTDTQLISLLQQQLDIVQTFVDAWQPYPPPDFLQEFQSGEVVHLLTQARVYRLAALLMVHRLRHRFGEEDSQADIWSREVMTELELAQQITQKPVRFVTLPFIISAVEIRDPVARSRALRNVDEYVDRFTPVVQQATKVFLARVWQERDCQTTRSWFDSVHKPCVVLDSIGASVLPLVR